MMGTQNAAVESRSGLSGLFGAQGALESGNFGADGEFTEALQEQLGGLLTELGVDPKSLHGMDIKAMLAQLQELLKGQLGAAGGEGLPFDADALGLLSEDGESSGADMSLAALKLFLQANGQQEASSEEDLEAQAALAALLQQWAGQSGAVGGKGDGGDGTAGLLAQLRHLLAHGSMADAEGMESRRQLFDLFSQAMSERGGDASSADPLALLRASLTANSRGNEQANAAADGMKAFDLARLLTPDGARQLADRLALIAQARDGKAELKLHPPSLGSMEVRVSMDADRAHVHFVSANPAVRDLLEAALPRLREALAQDGISLGDASVSDQPPQSRDEANAEGKATGDGEGSGDINDDNESLLAAEGPVAGSTLSALARKLDLFA